MTTKRLNLFLFACIAVALAAAWAFSAEPPVPRFVPIPKFTPIPVFKTVEVQVSAVVKSVEKVRETPRKLTKKVRQIIAWEPGPCPTCPATPVYGEVEVPLTPDEIKVSVVLDKFADNSLTKEEVADLKATVPGETIKQVMRQRWSIGTCGMACRSGGSLLYNVYEDGTEEVAPEQPAEAPEEGVHSGGGVRTWRLRGRR